MSVVGNGGLRERERERGGETDGQTHKRERGGEIRQREGETDI